MNFKDNPWKLAAIISMILNVILAIALIVVLSSKGTPQEVVSDTDHVDTDSVVSEIVSSDDTESKEMDETTGSTTESTSTTKKDSATTNKGNKTTTTKKSSATTTTAKSTTSTTTSTTKAPTTTTTKSQDNYGEWIDDWFTNP